MINPYDTLEILPGATQSEIRKAFRSKAKAAHPDHGGSEGEFARLREAYELLKDPHRRQAFDETGETDAYDRVQRMILEVFNSILIQGDFKGDIVEVCKKKMTFVCNQNKGKIITLEYDISRMKIQRGRIFFTEEGANAWHKVCDDAIARSQGSMESLSTDNEVINLALDEMDHYCDKQSEMAVDVPLSLTYYTTTGSYP